jgi:hypothetical protein
MNRISGYGDELTARRWAGAARQTQAAYRALVPRIVGRRPAAAGQAVRQTV